ncbi:MAG: ATPase domain-containing protein [Candidatus Micrarchaeota archaeon]
MKKEEIFMERRFIKSGIPGLDEVLGGGLLEKSVITVSGPTGSGKSTLAAQFLYNGAVESGEPGLYISIEESRKDFFFHMGGFNWDFPTLEKERRFILLDYPIHEVDQIVEQAGAIAEIINSTGVKRVVIDSIMPIALYFKGDEERKRGFLKFIENLRRWDVTIMIVSEDLKMGHGSRLSSEYGVESFTDGWVNIFFRYDEKTMSRSRFIEVIKMKGVEHSARAYPARISKDGFSVGSGQDNPPAPKQEARVQPAPMEEKRASEGRKLMKPIAPPPKAKEGPGKIAPAKMSPALAEKLAEAKKRLMKKR